MKKGLFVLLVLISIVTTSYPATRRGMDHLIFGSSIGKSIIVRDFEIPPSGNLRFLREAIATSPGAVGNIGAGYLNTNDRFNLLHSYQDSNDEIKWQNIEFDFDSFSVLKTTQVAGQYGGYSGGTFQVRTGPTRGRFYSVEPDFDVATQKTNNTSGKPFGKRSQGFNNDSDFFPVGISYEPNGFYSAQALFQRSTGRFFGDFRSQKATGKPENDLKRYIYDNDVANIALGARYDFNGTFTYLVATRDVKKVGSTYKTAVGVAVLNDDHIPIDFRFAYNFKNISVANLNAAVFDSIDIYSFGNRRLLIAGVPVSGNKFIAQAWWLNPGTLDILGKQTLISKQDLNQWNSDFSYAYYTAGFYYEDDDY